MIYTKHNRHFAKGQDVNHLPPRSEIVVSVPIYAYVHSGVVFSDKPFHQPWDSGQCGVAVATKQDMLHYFGGPNATQKRKQEMKITLRHLINNLNEEDDDE